MAEAVQITSPLPLPITGNIAVSATSVSSSTGPVNGLPPAVGTLVGGVGPSGSFQSFAVDASSNVKVTCISGCSGSAGSGVTNIVSTNSLTVSLSTTQVVSTTITIQNIQNALPAGSNSLGTVNVISSNTFSVSGTFFQASQPVNFNGIAQPILVATGTQNIYSLNTATITHNGVAQPVISTSPVNFGGIAQPVLVATGTQNIYSLNTSTISNTSFAVSITSGVTNVVSTSPVNFGGIAQPVLVATGTASVVILSTPVFTLFNSTSGVVNLPGSAAIGTVNIISTQPFTVISTGVVTQPVSGTFFQSIQPIVLTSTPPVQVIQSTGGAVQVGNWSVAVLSTPTFTTVASTMGVQPMPITKGTQGTVGFTVQELKDAGRNPVIWYVTNSTVGATTVESAITLTKSSGTAATFTCQTCQITSGKTLRIQSISFSSQGNAVATAQTTKFNLRLATSGNCLLGTTPVWLSAVTATAATASAFDRYAIDIHDGYELGSSTVFCASVNSTFTANAPTANIVIVGYEY